MKVYDKAYELKKALMESQEIKDYRESLERVKANPTNKRMLDDFRKKQIELQAEQFSGNEPNKDKVEQLEKLYSVISLNSDIRKFLQCEYRFSVLMNDISKIISEAVDMDLGFEEYER